MTKKMIVAFDPDNPEKASSDFLVPESTSFMSIKTGKPREYGLVVYTGMELAPNDLLSKLIDFGRKIDDVSRTLSMLDAYLGMIKEMKIGDVVRIAASENDACFSLKKTKFERRNT